ncbi:hypothetical protein FGADI_2075 [Fusarium gaditjirri]|uniref:Uncharacterized protein n=1 Tax=Fusarium gaditjirri TaxID=282569 RepID=A0A8H4TIY1_9HYPO|nr:hypothetical protein FGADI_2075 [Fusarium gaditjirri]
MDICGPPSIILDGKSVTLAGGGKDISECVDVVMSRRGQDNKWSSLSFKSTHELNRNEKVTATIVYKPSTNAPLKYIYAFRFGTDYMTIDMIRESSFNDLSRDDSIQWQHFHLSNRDENWIDRAWAPIIIHDRTTRKNRLYIFTYFNGVGFTYSFFPLRQDGSIDSYNELIRVQSPQSLKTRTISPNPKRVKVHESEGRLILLVETGEKKDPLLCYTGNIQENGLAPGENDWTKVTLSLGTPETDRDAEATFASVITPSSYQ